MLTNTIWYSIVLVTGILVGATYTRHQVYKDVTTVIEETAASLDVVTGCDDDRQACEETVRYLESRQHMSCSYPHDTPPAP